MEFRHNKGMSMKEFADDIFNFDENGGKFFKRKTLLEMEKLLVTSNFSLSHSVFKRLVLQTCKNQGLFGKGLTYYHTMPHFDTLQICNCEKHCEKRRNCL